MSIEDLRHLPVFAQARAGNLWRLYHKPISKRWEEQLRRALGPRKSRLKEGMIVKEMWDPTLYQIWSPWRDRAWVLVPLEGGPYVIRRSATLYIVRHTAQEA